MVAVVVPNVSARARRTALGRPEKPKGQPGTSVSVGSVGSGQGEGGAMIRDPFERLEKRASAQLQIEVPIQTKLPIEMKVMHIPVRWKRAKITARFE